MRVQKLRIGLEAQRGIAQTHDVIFLRGDERDVGGHAGPQQQIGIFDVDHRVVGDHVLQRLRGVANLPQLAR